MYFAFWFSYSPGNKTLTSDAFVPDRVSDGVFLADSVAFLQHIHALLVQSGSCFLKHVFGASAKALRLLLLHITRSRFVRAEFSLRGLELVSANITPRYSMFGWRRGAGVRPCASLAAHSAWRARCLPPKPYVSWLYRFSAVGSVWVVNVTALLGRDPGHRWMPRLSTFVRCWGLLFKNQSASCCLLGHWRGEIKSSACPLRRLFLCYCSKQCLWSSLGSILK